ncbi:hypothetical protein LP419_02915 [Massilia sp. H-1]|nr:hypothetical protein LP419_02915 [Massilia sp. H-1]
MALHVPTYWKHVATVLGGALGAQALPLLAAPLITRLCSPTDMGAFMVWFGIVAVAAIGATLRLEAAMILDHDSEHQATCFRVVAWSATLTALLVTAGAAAARAGLADGGQAAVVCLAHHRLRHLDHGHHADHAGLRHFAQRLRQGGARQSDRCRQHRAVPGRLAAGRRSQAARRCWPGTWQDWRRDWRQRRCCSIRRAHGRRCGPPRPCATTCSGTGPSGASRCPRTCSMCWSANCRCS